MYCGVGSIPSSLDSPIILSTKSRTEFMILCLSVKFGVFDVILPLLKCFSEISNPIDILDSEYFPLEFLFLIDNTTYYQDLAILHPSPGEVLFFVNKLFYSLPEISHPTHGS